MKKKGSDLSNYLILLLIAAGIAGSIGWFWTLVAVGVFVAVIFIMSYFDVKFEDQYPTDEFGPLFKNPDEAKAFYLRLRKISPDRSMRLRCQEILRESLEIALRSKKREVAESRMKLARERYFELKTEHDVPDKVWAAISKKYDESVQAFSTQIYINEAQAYLDKIKKLKTDKAKKKYADMARSVIVEALRDASADKSLLNAIYDRIPDL